MPGAGSAPTPVPSAVRCTRCTPLLLLLCAVSLADAHVRQALCQPSPWSAWSQCGVTCGGGLQTQKRELLQQPPLCRLPPRSHRLDRTRSCQTQRCPKSKRMRLPRARVHGAPNAASATAAAAAAAGAGTAAGAHEHAAVLLSGRIARETAASFTGAKRARLSRIFAQLVEAGAMGASIRRAALVGVVPLRPRGVVLDFKVTMGATAAAAAAAAGAFVGTLANGDREQAAAAAAGAVVGAGGGGGGAAAEEELADAQDRQADEREDASAVAALLGGADFGSELKARFESRLPEIDTQHAGGGATDESGRHFAPVEGGEGGAAAEAAAAEAETEGAETALLLLGELIMGKPVVSVPKGWAAHSGQEGARGGAAGGSVGGKAAAAASAALLLAGDPHHLTWQARKEMVAELQAEVAAAGGAATWQRKKHLEELRAELAATARAPTAAPALAALGGGGGGASAERAAVERRWRTVALSLLLGIALCSGCLTLYKAQLERQRGRLQSRRTRRQRDAKRFGKSWWGVKNQPPPPPPKSRLGSASMRAVEDASNCQAGAGSLFLTELVRRLTGGGADDDDGGEGGGGRRRSSRRWSRRRRSSDEWSD